MTPAQIEIVQKLSDALTIAARDLQVAVMEAQKLGYGAAVHVKTSEDGSRILDVDAVVVWCVPGNYVEAMNRKEGKACP